MLRRLDKGIIGEAKVLSDLVSSGFEVFLPFSGYSVFDLVAHKDGRLIRISVKYTSMRHNKTSWRVMLASTSLKKDGVRVKCFNGSTCDILAVYIEPLDRVFYIASRLLACKKETALNEGKFDSYTLGLAFQNSIDTLSSVSQIAS